MHNGSQNNGTGGRSRRLDGPAAGRPTLHSAFSAALFDFDGTLVDSEGPCAVAFADIVNSLGAEMDEREAYEVCYGRSWRDAFQRATHSYPVLDGLVGEFLDTTCEVIDEAGGFLGEPILSSVELLRQLAKRMPVAVVSGSFRRNIETSLEQLGIVDLVTLVVGNEDYDAGKPSPEPYLTAAKKLAIPPERCVVFEDSDVGIRSAHGAGMRCIALRPERPAGEACLSVTSLDTADVWQFLGDSANVPASSLS